MDKLAQRLETRAYRPIAWQSPWQHFFLLAVGVLATTILLKFIAIQYLELLELLQIALLFVAFVQNDLRARWLRPLLILMAFYVVFMVAAISLAVAALRFQFYIPAGVIWIGSPVYITVERVIELIAATFTMVVLADLFRRETNKLRFTMRVYFWMGVVSAVYSYVSYVVVVNGGNMYGAYLVNHRLRGFYNEGGPWGLYLMTVIFVGVALYQLRWESLWRMRVGLALLPVALYLSYSKAAFSAILTLLLVNGLFARGLGKRLVLLGSLVLVVVFGASRLDLGVAAKILDLNGTGNYERVSRMHGGDPNLVYGRIAARFIAPRMIKAHPYTGVGWGNYGLLRNDPQYRGASYYAEIPDAPALGMLGYAAELGIPLTVMLVLLLLAPWVMLKRRHAPTWLTNLALMSPMAHFFGAQLNVTYPWIVLAFALGLGYADIGAVAERMPVRKLQAARRRVRISWNGSGGLVEGRHG